MSDQFVSENKEYVDLPTGKPHVSFSEAKSWASCSYQHKLKFVKKIDLDKPSIHMDFGTAVHAACEDYLKTREMKPKIALDTIDRLWEKNKEFEGFEPETISQFHKEATAILEDVPAWLEETFPGWQFVDAEHYLYERIGESSHAFKGFIDGVIVAKGPRNKQLVWLLDWKSCLKTWHPMKRRDPLVRLQLELYKSFWCNKTKTPQKDVRCGFVLLKRSAKKGHHCELVTVSVGEKTETRALKVITNMIHSVKKGIAIKNRSSCKFCPYANTEHCT